MLYSAISISRCYRITGTSFQRMQKALWIASTALQEVFLNGAKCGRLPLIPTNNLCLPRLAVDPVKSSSRSDYETAWIVGRRTAEMRGDLGTLESRANQQRVPCWFVPAPTIAPPPKVEASVGPGTSIGRRRFVSQASLSPSKSYRRSALQKRVACALFTARRLWFVSTCRRSSLSCFRPRQFGSAQRSSSHYTLHTLRFLVGHPHPLPRSFRSVPSALWQTK